MPAAAGKHRRLPAGRAVQSRAFRIVLTVLAALALAFSAVGLVARAQAVTTIPRLVLAVGSTFIPLVAVAGLVFALASRRKALSILGVVLVMATIAIQVKWYYFGKPTRAEDYVELRVLSSNLRKGRADAAEFVALARSGADVITVAELTPEAVQRFDDAGIAATFPYSLLNPFPLGPQSSGGVGIWSRFPLTPVSAPRHRNVTMPAAWVKLPQLDFEPLVASVHIMSPVAGDENSVDDWRYGMAGAKAKLDNYATAAGPAAVIIGGDYNSTPDMRQFRDLLTDGYQDAVEQTGAGFAPTFKADGWLPPVITIDHILTRNAVASAIRTVTMKGSDHRALIATIRVPIDTAP